MWNASKNKKMQAAVQRTSHPDAQWWPHAGLGLFMHWGIVSEFPKPEKLGLEGGHKTVKIEGYTFLKKKYGKQRNV